MQLSNEKPRVLIIGLGSYFNKLRDGIQSYFILEKLLDCKSFEALQLKQADKNKFTQINPNTKEISVDEDIDCIMILTPPVYHVPYVKMLACHQKPILVEKPVAINSSELSQLHHSISENPHLYCSDFYPDVRAIPILTWILPNNDSILKSEINIEGYKQLWDGGLDYLGPIIKIEGKLLEGSGDAATFNGREWLWDPSQGGVLLDLMYHYFTLSSYLFDEEISLEQVKISTLSKNENLIPWNPNLKSSETYALV